LLAKWLFDDKGGEEGVIKKEGNGSPRRKVTSESAERDSNVGRGKRGTMPKPARKGEALLHKN